MALTRADVYFAQIKASRERIESNAYWPNMGVWLPAGEIPTVTTIAPLYRTYVTDNTLPLNPPVVLSTEPEESKSEELKPEISPASPFQRLLILD